MLAVRLSILGTTHHCITPSCDALVCMAPSAKRRHMSSVSAVQALGRCIRHKNDYGAIILLDERLRASKAQGNLSRWLRDCIACPSTFAEAQGALQSFFEHRAQAAAAGAAEAAAAAAAKATCLGAAACCGTVAPSEPQHTWVRIVCATAQRRRDVTCSVRLWSCSSCNAPSACYRCAREGTDSVSPMQAPSEDEQIPAHRVPSAGVAAGSAAHPAEVKTEAGPSAAPADNAGIGACAAVKSEAINMITPTTDALAPAVKADPDAGEAGPSAPTSERPNNVAAKLKLQLEQAAKSSGVGYYGQPIPAAPQHGDGSLAFAGPTRREPAVTGTTIASDRHAATGSAGNAAQRVHGVQPSPGHAVSSADGGVAPGSTGAAQSQYASYHSSVGGMVATTSAPTPPSALTAMRASTQTPLAAHDTSGQPNANATVRLPVASGTQAMQIGTKRSRGSAAGPEWPSGSTAAGSCGDSAANALQERTPDAPANAVQGSASASGATPHLTSMAGEANAAWSGASAPAEHAANHAAHSAKRAGHAAPFSTQPKPFLSPIPEEHAHAEHAPAHPPARDALVQHRVDRAASAEHVRKAAAAVPATQAQRKQPSRMSAEEERLLAMFESDEHEADNQRHAPYPNSACKPAQAHAESGQGMPASSDHTAPGDRGLRPDSALPQQSRDWQHAGGHVHQQSGQAVSRQPHTGAQHALPGPPPLQQQLPPGWQGADKLERSPCGSACGADAQMRSSAGGAGRRPVLTPPAAATVQPARARMSSGTSQLVQAEPPCPVQTIAHQPNVSGAENVPPAVMQLSAQASKPATAAQQLSQACQQWLESDLRRLRQHALAAAADQLQGLSEAQLTEQLQANIICLLEDACATAAKQNLVPWLGDIEFAVMPVGLCFVVWCAANFDLWHHPVEGPLALKDDPEAPEDVVAEVNGVGDRWGALDAQGGGVLAKHLGGMDTAAALETVRDAYLACVQLA